MGIQVGIYIKGIELPKLPDCSKSNNVPEIYNLHGAIIVYPNGKAELKSYTGRFEGVYDIIAVPPHGRLIDADALIERCQQPDVIQRRDAFFDDLDQMSITRNQDGSMEVEFAPKEKRMVNDEDQLSKE